MLFLKFLKAEWTNIEIHRITSNLGFGLKNTSKGHKHLSIGLINIIIGGYM